MRLFLLFLLIPLLSSAQDLEQKQERKKLVQRTHFRAGLTLQRDRRAFDYYTFIAADIVPIYRRKHLLSGVASLAPLPQFQNLRTQVRFAYGDMQFEGGEDQVGSNYFAAGLQEAINYSHLQFAGGLCIEATPEASFVPYFGVHYLLAKPFRLTYKVVDSNPPSTTVPSLVQIEGGGRLSQGWEISTGFRILMGPHLVFKAGVYYTEHDILMNWSQIHSRRFSRNTILRTEGFGSMMSLQYQW